MQTIIQGELCYRSKNDNCEGCRFRNYVGDCAFLSKRVAGSFSLGDIVDFEKAKKWVDYLESKGFTSKEGDATGIVPESFYQIIEIQLMDEKSEEYLSFNKSARSLSYCFTCLIRLI